MSEEAEAVETTWCSRCHRVQLTPPGQTRCDQCLGLCELRVPGFGPCELPGVWEVWWRRHGTIHRDGNLTQYTVHHCTEHAAELAAVIVTHPQTEGMQVQRTGVDDD